MLEDKTSLVISRHWNNPQITVCINSERIEVKMSVEDFCKAIVAEIPHPIFMQTRGGMEKQCLKVINTVLEKTKEATSQV